MKIKILSANNMANTIIDAGELGSVTLGGYVDIYQGLHDGKTGLEAFLQGVYDRGVKAGSSAPAEGKAEVVEAVAVEADPALEVADTEPAPEPTVKAKRGWFGK